MKIELFTNELGNILMSYQLHVHHPPPKHIFLNVTSLAIISVGKQTLNITFKWQ